MLSVIKGMVWTKVKNVSAEPIYIIIKGKGTKTLYPNETYEILNKDKWTAMRAN
jgi:hypothetical protein